MRSSRARNMVELTIVNWFSVAVTSAASTQMRPHYCKSYEAEDGRLFVSQFDLCSPELTPLLLTRASSRSVSTSSEYVPRSTSGSPMEELRVLPLRAQSISTIRDIRCIPLNHRFVCPSFATLSRIDWWFRKLSFTICNLRWMDFIQMTTKQSLLVSK